MSYLSGLEHFDGTIAKDSFKGDETGSELADKGGAGTFVGGGGDGTLIAGVSK